jgi:hypothetical protein
MKWSEGFYKGVFSNLKSPGVSKSVFLSSFSSSKLNLINVSHSSLLEKMTMSLGISRSVVMLKVRDLMAMVTLSLAGHNCYTFCLLFDV